MIQLTDPLATAATQLVAEFLIDLLACEEKSLSLCYLLAGAPVAPLPPTPHTSMITGPPHNTASTQHWWVQTGRIMMHQHFKLVEVFRTMTADRMLFTLLQFAFLGIFCCENPSSSCLCRETGQRRSVYQEASICPRPPPLTPGRQEKMTMWWCVCVQSRSSQIYSTPSSIQIGSAR